MAFGSPPGPCRLFLPQPLPLYGAVKPLRELGRRRQLILVGVGEREEVRRCGRTGVDVELFEHILEMLPHRARREPQRSSCSASALVSVGISSQDTPIPV
jgi:hypothetical protein